MTNSYAFNTHDELKERGFFMQDAPITIANYDPAGDGDDNDALVIVSREEWRRGELHDPDLAMEFVFRILGAHRMPQGIEFPDKQARLIKLNRSLVKWNEQGRTQAHFFGVETNGVGYAMASSLKSKITAPVIGYTTVGSISSDKPYTSSKVSMPRLAALDHLRMLMEIHRIKMVRDAVGTEHMMDELNSFVWASAGRPEALKGQRDDLVMALCGAIWIASKILPPLTRHQTAGKNRPPRDRGTRMRLQ